MEKIIDDLMESIEFVQPIYEMIKQIQSYQLMKSMGLSINNFQNRISSIYQR